MATATETSVVPFAGERRVVLRGVGWEGYQALLGLVGDRPVRLAYAHGDVEIMSPSFRHELSSRRLNRFLDILTEELDLPMLAAGATTLEREDLDKGVEPDESYYFGDVGGLASPDRLDLAVHRPPDLVIEIEFSRSILDRLGIYGAIGIPEIWRFNGRVLTIVERSEDGSYAERPTSRAFPFLSAAEISKLLGQEAGNNTEWARLVRREVRAILDARPANEAGGD